VIDHIGLHVRDVARATEFYLKALSPLGYGIVMQVSAEETGHGAAVGFGAGQKPSFWDRRERAQERADACGLRRAISRSGRCLLCRGDEGRRQRQWPARA
jgi:catechol 2,3-dioxygenase-like lactoylglutathione lyase family enzyme